MVLSRKGRKRRSNLDRVKFGALLPNESSQGSCTCLACRFHIAMLCIHDFHTKFATSSFLQSQRRIRSIPQYKLNSRILSFLR
ncbi:Uncharacterized protein TCM_024729 [Theobroma cacao]|uniref:Uncharacterized protein n=1 Tax=Theobroma cacao TaxID=3641 RepID=A0A061EW51_THECC|nr:Uncharacterized protein TCM_024729 [Theobroma cacao]